MCSTLVLAPELGLEPRTFWLTARRTAIVLHRNILYYGSPRENWTHRFKVENHASWPLDDRAIISWKQHSACYTQDWTEFNRSMKTRCLHRLQCWYSKKELNLHLVLYERPALPLSYCCRWWSPRDSNPDLGDFKSPASAIGLEDLGVPSRTRTYNLQVKSPLHHHCAIGTLIWCWPQELNP